MNKIKLLNIITTLCKFGERQFEQETKARLFIESILRNWKIKWALQKFTTYIPRTEKVSLTADNKSIPALATSFVSGVIEDKSTLISSLTDSELFCYQPNINFNPLCASISRSNHYFAPAVAIRATDLAKIIKSKKVRAEVKVEKIKHQSANILFGNLTNPKSIIFSHYDSIGPGAVDNATGVALSLSLISNYPQLLKSTLFVIAGNEELSYDETIYWGHGYRVFEDKFGEIMKKAKQLIILDCLGHADTKIIRDKETLMLGFPIKSIDKLLSKTVMLSGSINELMKIYHSDLDMPEKIDYKLLERAGAIAMKLIR